MNYLAIALPVNVLATKHIWQFKYTKIKQNLKCSFLITLATFQAYKPMRTHPAANVLDSYIQNIGITAVRFAENARLDSLFPIKAG